MSGASDCPVHRRVWRIATASSVDSAKGIGLATRKPPTDCYRRVLGRGLRQLAQAHARFDLIRRHNNQRADLSFVVISDMDLSWPVNHMGEMGRVTTRHPPDRNKELMVMRIVGDARQGHPAASS